MRTLVSGASLAALRMTQPLAVILSAAKDLGCALPHRYSRQHISLEGQSPDQAFCVSDDNACHKSNLPLLLHIDRFRNDRRDVINAKADILTPHVLHRRRNNES